MIEFEIRGGLGDGFIELHETTAYEDLESLGARERATVYSICHNPYLHELFRWHPARERIRIVSSPTFFFDYLNVEKRRLSGLPDNPPTRRPVRPAAPIRFYPSAEDLRVLRCLPDRPFLALAASASSVDRNLPEPVIQAAVRVCAARGIPIVTFGRTYQNPLSMKVEAAVSGPTVVDLVDCLSVPGTAEALKRARAVLSCHSCLLLLTWYERLPNFTVYPKFYAEHDFWRPSPFGFGKDFPETVHGLFEGFKPERLEAFLDENFPEAR